MERAHWFEDEPYLRFSFVNPTGKAYKIAMVHLMEGEQDGRKIHVEFGREVRKEPGILAIVEPHSTIEGIVLVPKGTDLEAASLRFFAPLSTRPILAAPRIWYADPVPPDVVARHKRYGQTSVNMQLLFGGFWTSAGDDLGGLEATSLAGLEAHIQKGYPWGGAFEGHFVVARSGDAQFDGMPWSGTTGTVTRQATLGRALGGVAMRFGYDYVITGRAGLGVQVASYDSVFTAGGAPMDGPGDGLEVDGLWSDGASFDARLGMNWSVGFAGSFTDAFNSGDRSLETGLHLGA